MISTEDRKEINTALAKAIAYVNCGKQQDASKWAAHLIKLLQCKEIFKDNYLNQ